MNFPLHSSQHESHRNPGMNKRLGQKIYRFKSSSMVFSQRENSSVTSSQGDLFLQHPKDYDVRVDYVNPQYLVRPGSLMPKIGVDTSAVGSGSMSASKVVLDDTRKAQLIQIFNSANGPTGNLSLKRS
jgi:hypothetical protein